MSAACPNALCWNIQLPDTSSLLYFLMGSRISAAVRLREGDGGPFSSHVLPLRRASPSRGESGTAPPRSVLLMTSRLRVRGDREASMALWRANVTHGGFAEG